MEYFLGIMVFVLGAALGSFVNMLSYRTALRYEITRNKKQDTNKDRSFCDFCGRQLKWWENVPIISWIFLRGKSSCCANPLPWQYPVVELAMGVLAVIGFLIIKNILGINMIFLGQMGFYLAIITLLMFLLVFDLKYMILPDFGVFILIGLALVGVVFDEVNIIPYLLSALGGFLFLGGLHWLTKGKGMGFGDAKLAIFMGFFLGWPNILVAFYVAFILGAVVGIFLVVLRKAGRRSQIAFGPFLIIGVVVAWVWGEEIIKFLISNF